MLSVGADEAEKWERKKKKKNPDQGFSGRKKHIYTSLVLIEADTQGPTRSYCLIRRVSESYLSSRTIESNLKHVHNYYRINPVTFLFSGVQLKDLFVSCLKFSLKLERANFIL